MVAVKKPAIIGAHHKTGATLAWSMIRLLARHVPKAVRGEENPAARLHNSTRKLPLSLALGTVQKKPIVYSIWFEHAFDVRGVRFLHFVRHPQSCLASAYLYHKRGAPSDPLRWIEWPIFAFNGPKSYVALLNAVDPADGIMLEAIRTYPEALGSARAASSGARLLGTDYMPIWLDDFDKDPLRPLAAIFHFVCGDDAPGLDAFLAAARSGDVILGPGSAAVARGHVTRHDAARSIVEKAIAESPAIARLYGPVFRQMGLAEPAPAPQAAAAGSGLPGLLADIERHAPLLVTSPDILKDQPGFWRAPISPRGWQSFALSNVGNGHLMMYPFMQAYLDMRRQG